MTPDSPLIGPAARPHATAAGPSSGASVSVLIPTHKDAHLLRKSLPVLLDHSGGIEVVVVNNDPSQGVAAAIAHHAGDARIRILEMGYEAGFARAMNRGIRESSGDLVMLCNADLFPTPTYLGAMLAFFERRPAAGAAIGKILRYDLEADRQTDVIDTTGLLLSRQRRFMTRGEGERDTGQFDEDVEVFAVDGAALVLRRAALETIRFEGEYLDENFFAHKEDHDISWRLRLAGWECWYVHSALAYHARTTRGLGSTGYLKAVQNFHENERQKSESVRINAMKNQWLMLLKNEDGFNFARDFPFIVAREAMVLLHRMLFAPKALVAVPITLKLLPETLRKRRAAKRNQRMDPRALRRWLAGEGERASESPPRQPVGASGSGQTREGV